MQISSMLKVSRCCVGVFVLGLLGRAAQPADLDALFAKYWAAKNPGEAAKSAGDIVKSGASFDDVYARLKQGRSYAKDVATGFVPARRGEFPCTLDVPETYDPSHRYQVRFHLHGGISNSRENAERRGRPSI